MSATAAAVDHIHHPNADHQVAFKGLAAYDTSCEVRPLEYNPPKLSEDFVEVEISHCGICGSDVHAITSGWFPANYPVIPGHEIVGTVVAAGSAVKNVKVGDRVGVGAMIGSCGNKLPGKPCPECVDGWVQHCRNEMVLTYNHKRPDGQVTQGGYADRIRLDGQYAFKLPEAISSVDAAPLMCGGATVYSPLARAITRPGMKIGVIGIGGLGHMGVMFASKLLGGSAEVTAISQSSRKKEEALKMGAKHFLDMSDKAAVAAASRTFDYILSTADGNGLAVSEWISLIKFDGTLCMVGAPNEPISLNLFAMFGARVKIDTSGIGSRKEIEEMLAFAAEHNVRPIIEKMPMAQANEGLKKVRDGTVRFRVVLENPPKQK